MPETPSRKIDRTILVLTQDARFRALFSGQSNFQHFRMLWVSAESEALSAIEQERPDIIFLDIENAVSTELNMVHFVKERSSHSEIVIITSVEKIEEATTALRNGASFYLIKPLETASIAMVLAKLSLKLERNEQYIDLERHFLEEMMSGSEAMHKVLKLSFKIAPTSSTVLLTGESGTGKEFFARVIHRLSRRTDGPFVAVNCGAIPENLFESEIFGHKKGSFTGAIRDKNGLAEEANLGTLFLDEVGELSPAAQVKLLRFLQDRIVRRVGDTQSRQVNVRVIAATNKDLRKKMETGEFREDLFYRLNVFNISLPPLRERKETIPHLLKIFIHKLNAAMDKHVDRISKQAEAVLAGYDYPGNIRELENITEHAVAMASTHEIRAEDLPEFMFRSQARLPAPAKATERNEILSLAALEKKHIEEALVSFSFNYSETARKLGISRSTLWRKIKEYGIEARDEEKK